MVLILFSQYHSQQVGWKAETASPKWPILCRVQGCKTLTQSIKFIIYIRLSLKFPRNPKCDFSVRFLLTLYSKYACTHVFYILRNCPITLMLFTVYRYKIETVKCLFFFTGYYIMTFVIFTVYFIFYPAFSMCAVIIFSYCYFLVHGQVTIILVVSVCLSVCLSICLSVCLCRGFLSRLWSDFDQTRTHVICLGLVVSPRI